MFLLTALHLSIIRPSRLVQCPPLHHCTRPPPAVISFTTRRARTNRVSKAWCLTPSENDDALGLSPPCHTIRCTPLRDLFDMIRPATILQAVGALVVGRLAIISGGTVGPLRPLGWAAASVYLSYGAGMAINDVADGQLDALHETKRERPVASGRISATAARAYCAVLAAGSLALAARATGMRSGFVTWTASNLLLMLGYASGLQRLLLVKNALCGWLAISPLIGAALLAGAGLGGTSTVGTASVRRLWWLAAAGFPLQVAREVLKDAEDVEADRGKKLTLPLAVGTEPSRRAAHGLVGVVLGWMVFTPHYWQMFSSTPPIYAAAMAICIPMCVRASRLPLREGEQLLKRSIYVLLVGMVGGLVLGNVK